LHWGELFEDDIGAVLPSARRPRFDRCWEILGYGHADPAREAFRNQRRDMIDDFSLDRADAHDPNETSGVSHRDTSRNGQGMHVARRARVCPPADRRDESIYHTRLLQASHSVPAASRLLHEHTL
jgi:hypothetical protein